MKRNVIYRCLTSLLFSFPLLVACEKDLPIYDNPVCGLQFIYENEKDSVVNYSFAYGPKETTQDTVKVEIQLMGVLMDQDRTISLKQITTGDHDAVAGVHYVPFNDPELSKKYVLPKNAVSVELPIVLKRDESLKEANYNLKIAIQANENFTFAAKERNSRGIVIADQLIKPNNWDRYVSNQFGPYTGPVKHQFMIDVTGLKWDDDFVDNDLVNILESDQNYVHYLKDLLKNALDEYNSTHDEPLREENNGEFVTFPVL